MCRQPRWPYWMAPPMRPAKPGNKVSKRYTHCGARWHGNWGGAEAFSLVKAADANGTSPGKDVLCTLLTQCAPCVVLLDELVVYIRQFVESQALTGGTFDSKRGIIAA